MVRHDVLNLLPPLEWASISKLVLDLSMESGPLRRLGAWKSSGLNSSSDEFQATLIDEVFTDGSLQRRTRRDDYNLTHIVQRSASVWMRS